MAAQSIFPYEDSCLLPEMTVRELIHWIRGPEGLAVYKAARHGKTLVKALDRIGSRAGALYRREGGGLVWPVRPVIQPEFGRLNEPVRLAVQLPRATDKGVTVDWAALTHYAWQDRLMAKVMLNLQAMWSRPGTKIMPRFGGRYGNTRSDEAYDQIMPIEGKDLTWLGFPTEGPSGGRTGRNRLQRVRGCLTELEAIHWAIPTESGKSVKPGEFWGGRKSAGFDAVWRRLQTMLKLIRTEGEMRHGGKSTRQHKPSPTK